MNMDSKLQKEKFLHKKQVSGVRDKELEQFVENEDDDQNLDQDQSDYLVFKDGQDILNNEVSLKEIETEMLRLDQYDYEINFSTK